MLSDEKQRWQITLQSINDAVIVTNRHNQVTYLNPSAESLLGIALEDAMLNPLNTVMQLDQMSGDEDAPACFLAPVPAPQSQTGSAQLQTRLGHQIVISYSCAPLTGKRGLGAVYVLRDETEKKELLDSLRDMAFHDTLTTLPNRRAVEGRLARALRTARDQAQQHVFCYIDLDHFKLVNDTWFPLLVILAFWRHAYKRFPLTYSPLYWGAVFPLGMYTVCTERLAEVTGLEMMMTIPQAFIFVALAAWLAAFWGMLRKIWVSMLR